METFFISQDLWEVIEESYDEPSSEASATWTNAQQKQYKENVKKDANALRYIQQGVSKSIFPRIFGIKKAKDAWEVLQKEFQGSEKVTAIKLRTLWTNFDNLSMKETERVRDFFSKIAEIVNLIRSCGDSVEEKKIVDKILRVLPQKFQHVVTVIEESKDLSQLTMYELMGSLEAHENRMARYTDESLEQALQSKMNVTESKSKERTRRPDYQHQSSDSRSGSKGKQWKKNQSHFNRKANNNKNFNQCHICKKSNHESKDCWFRPCIHCKDADHPLIKCPRKQKDQANFMENDESSEQLFYSCMSSQEDQDIWYIDSGCSRHMTRTKSSFVNLDESFKSKVKLGDGKYVKVEGKGDITVVTKGGTPKLIKDVLYVPLLSQNLLSVGQLVEKGYALTFDRDKCTILDKKGEQAITTVPMASNRVFPLCMSHKENLALKSDVMDESMLWHMRYGHLNYESLKLLNKKDMVIGLPTVNSNGSFCEGCVYGKIHRMPFPKFSWRATTPLELVHADICGPTRTPSLKNRRYFLLFVDDYSRMMWVYFLEHKSEAFSMFLQFMAHVERESGQVIKGLRTDRGGEFISKPFWSYCKEKGIKRQLTVRQSPQQNGIAERKNRSIVEVARSMLKAKGLPNKYWAEAVNTAIYLLNRSPTKAVQHMTPYEAWFQRKPKIDHLKIFGCPAYYHVLPQNREKFDEKGEKCIFIGYSDHSKGYRLYNPNTQELIISRDVIFDEGGAWEWRDTGLDSQASPPRTSEITHLVSPGHENSTPSSSSTSHLVSSTTDSPPRKTRSLQEVYEACDVAFAAREPQSYDEAAGEEVWVQAMDEEMKMIEKNNTWQLVEKPPSKEIIGLKWVFKTKYNEDGSIQKHKARLVAKGYAQQPGIDFSETFAPVARMETIRTFLALAAQLKLLVYQLDVKSAFLNGEIEEEVYVQQPQGYVKTGQEDMVYRLQKALYGLKQAPRAWNIKIDSYFLQSGFQRSPSEPSLYVKTEEGTSNFLIACLYVDDLIYMGNSQLMMEDFKKDMMSRFEMTDLGLMRYFLGIQVKQENGRISLSQEKYATDLLKKFNMSCCKPTCTPMIINEKLSRNDGAEKVDETIYRKLVGSLIYLTNTRPDLVYAVSVVSRFMSEPSKLHFAAAKRILRYVQGTKSYGVVFQAEKDNKLVGYSDSDWAGSIDDRKSTSGNVFFLGTKPISWSSKKQSTVAMSSAEAEYISASGAACEAVWLRRILKDMKQCQTTPTILFCDNLSAIAMTKNPVFHNRSKHIELRHHFIRELASRGEIELAFCKTGDQVADIFTKPIPTAKFLYFREKLGVIDFSKLRGSVKS